jgi:hypothetical protein
MTDTETAKAEPAADPIAARKAAFEAEQASRQEKFERDTEAATNKLERDHEAAVAKANADEELRAAQQENDDIAFKHGWLTEADLEQRKIVAATQANHALLPHQAIGPDEETVKMAFPTHVTVNTDPTDDQPSQRIFFNKGVHDVPVSVSDHPYLADNGAVRIDDAGKPEAPDARAQRLKTAHDKAEKPKRRVRVIEEETA